MNETLKQLSEATNAYGDFAILYTSVLIGGLILVFLFDYYFESRIDSTKHDEVKG